MDYNRFLPVFTIVIILLLSLLFGPLVGAVDLSPSKPISVPGHGSVDVDVVSVPVEGRLDPAGYSENKYVLSLGAATVEISNLSGNPMVIYKLRVREVGYVASTTHFFGGEPEGQQTLTLEGAVLKRTSLPRETYRGELLVIKRVHERDTVLYRGNVTLRVGR